MTELSQIPLEDPEYDDPDDPVGPHQGEIEDDHRSPDEEDTHASD